MQQTPIYTGYPTTAPLDSNIKEVLIDLLNSRGSAIEKHNNNNIIIVIAVFFVILYSATDRGKAKKIRASLLMDHHSFCDSNQPPMWWLMSP